MVLAALVVGSASTACVSDEEGCSNDQKVDVILSQVGDHAVVTLELSDGHYDSFDALGVPWQVENPQGVTVPHGGDARGTLTLMEESSDGLVAGHDPVPTLLHFEPDAGRASSPVEFTTYGCA